MWEAAHFALLAVAVLALAGASSRVAAAITPDPLERILAAATLAVSAAVASSLSLGIVALGSDPLVLTGVAVVIWLLCRWRIADADPSLRHQVGEWWATRRGPSRVLIGTAVGALATWGGWLLLHPIIGTDGLHYHLADVATWVRTGRPGSLDPRVYFFPVEAYPKTAEITMTWACGIARSPLPWHPMMAGYLILIALAVWSVASSLGVSGLNLVLTTAAVATLPLCLDQLQGPLTDLPALAWLAITAALALAGRRAPGLLPISLIAAGLAIGTKTTTVPLAAGFVLFAIVQSRALRFRWPLMLSGAMAAVVVGGVWYIRNLLLHGSPVWPFVDLPFGDPLPSFFEEIKGSFLQYPAATLHGKERSYIEAVAGGIPLLAGVFVVAAIARRRAVAISGAIVAGSLLLWMNAPFTGDAGRDNWGTVVVSTTRYLLPTLAAGAICLGIATIADTRTRPVATGFLGLAIAANLIRIVDIEVSPQFIRQQPTLAMLAMGMMVGGLTGWLVTRLPTRSRACKPALITFTFASWLGLSVLAPNYSLRHAQVRYFDSDVLGFLLSQPGFDNGHESVSEAPTTIASLAGDRFAHPIELIGQHEPCDQVLERLRRGWIVLGGQFGPDVYAASFDADECLAGIQPVYSSPSVRVYAPRSS